MPGRYGRPRYRLLIWTDEAFNPEQCALALFHGDDKRGEFTWTPEPFDNLHDVVGGDLRALARQLTLW